MQNAALYSNLEPVLHVRRALEHLDDLNLSYVIVKSPSEVLKVGMRAQ